MKVILLTLLLTVPIFAQQVLLAPLGIWPFCQESKVSWCLQYRPGLEEYALYIQGSSSIAIAYHWSVTAMLHDGSIKIVSGVVQRTDRDGTFTVVAPISFGGAVFQPVIILDELAIVGTVVR